MQDGDIIVSFDPEVVTSLDDLHRLLTEDRIGAVVMLGILRGPDRSKRSAWRKEDVRTACHAKEISCPAFPLPSTSGV
jgi:S1-C subfamily serine protease